jgi:hypothetical protein
MPLAFTQRRDLTGTNGLRLFQSDPLASRERARRSRRQLMTRTSGSDSDVLGWSGAAPGQNREQSESGREEDQAGRLG